MCLVVFLTLSLKFPIQNSLSVAPKLPVSLCSCEKYENFRKTSTRLVTLNGTVLSLERVVCVLKHLRKNPGELRKYWNFFCYKEAGLLSSDK